MQFVSHLGPSVPLLGLVGSMTAAGAATYMVTSRIAANKMEVVKKELEKVRSQVALQLKVERDRAAVELKAERDRAALQLNVEKVSSATTSLVMEFLFRGDFSPMREALQAKLAKQAAASAASEPAAAPADQVLK